MIERFRSGILRIASASALIALRSGLEPVELWLSRPQRQAICRNEVIA